jgi:hypothetical protein
LEQRALDFNCVVLQAHWDSCEALRVALDAGRAALLLIRSRAHVWAANAS